MKTLGFIGLGMMGAPMASNRMLNDQCSSSPPPAKMMSCLPIWMSSQALPMQCALVEQAELME